VDGTPRLHTMPKQVNKGPTVLHLRQYANTAKADLSGTGSARELQWQL